MFHEIVNFTYQYIKTTKVVYSFGSGYSITKTTLAGGMERLAN